MNSFSTFLKANGLAVWLLLCGSVMPVSDVFGQTTDTLHVYDNLIIAPGETLTISPGTVVYFHGFFHINVLGTLIAIGEQNQPILFTSSDTLGLYDTHLASGGWNGIRFLGDHTEDNPRQKSQLVHCVFEHAKGSLADFHNGGAITIQNTSDVAIAHCTFRYNYVYRRGGAIALLNSNATVSHSRFYGNSATNNESELWTYGGAVYLNGSRSEITWCRFEENYASGIGGALAIEFADPVLHNNIIHNNNAPLGGGMGVLRSQINSVFSNNQITQNQSMFFGGGIAFIEASATLINHTIAGNCSSYGGGLYFNENSSPVFINSIIYGNQSYGGVPNQVFIWDVFSSPDFFYNNVEGGLEAFEGGNSGESFPGTYLHNIDMPPLFDWEADNPFVPLPDSPCIDAGHPNAQEMEVYPLDLAGMPRFSGMRVDMGAYEHQDPFAYYSVEIQTAGQGDTDPEPGQHMFREGVQVSFTAIPQVGWRFEKWETNAGSLSDNPLVLEINEPLLLTAVFLDDTNIASWRLPDIQIWPNPSRGIIHVGCLLDEAEIIAVQLTDLAGRTTLVSFTASHDPLGIRIDASMLPRGYYFLFLGTKKGSFKAPVILH